jgi:hypothetical protein
VLKLRSPQTAHQIFWEHNNCPLVYEYDPTDDGPECGIIRGIRVSHPCDTLNVERGNFKFTSMMLDATASYIRNSETPTRDRTVLLLAASLSVFADSIRRRGVEL